MECAPRLAARRALPRGARRLRRTESGRSARARAAAGPYRPTPYVKLKHPEWAKNAGIYQINARRLQLFEKDPIVWKEHPNGGLYKKLFALRRLNTALWNGPWGATRILVPDGAPAEVFSFVRRNDADEVFVKQKPAAPSGGSQARER